MLLGCRGVRSRTVALVVALVVVPAGPAAAADVGIRVEPEDGVRYGAATSVTATVTEAGAPLDGEAVVVEGRRFPFRGRWRKLAAGTTDAAGAVSVATELDRNHRVRARHVASGAVSATATAFVFPSFTLAFAELRPGVIRITQLYRVPADVRLTARTRFYVGSQRARRARLRATAPTRPLRPGRYRAVARVRIPASFGGRFRYVSCFAYSRDSGMGDPARRCPDRSFPLR